MVSKLLDQHFDFTRDTLSQELSGETVLLKLTDEQYFGLDQIGTRVLQGLVEESTPANIIESMLSEYEVSREKLTADVAELVNQLLEAGLISIRSETG